MRREDRGGVNILSGQLFPKTAWKWQNWPGDVSPRTPSKSATDSTIEQRFSTINTGYGLRIEKKWKRIESNFSWDYNTFMNRAEIETNNSQQWQINKTGQIAIGKIVWQQGYVKWWTNMATKTWKHSKSYHAALLTKTILDQTYSFMDLDRMICSSAYLSIRRSTTVCKTRPSKVNPQLYQISDTLFELFEGFPFKVTD